VTLFIYGLVNDIVNIPV